MTTQRMVIWFSLMMLLWPAMGSAQRRDFGNTRSDAPAPAASPAPADHGSVRSSSGGSTPAPAPAPDPTPVPQQGTTCSPGIVIDAPAPIYIAVAADDEGALSPGRSTRASFALWNVHNASDYAAFDFSTASVCAADDPEEDVVYRADDSGEFFDVSHDTDIRDLGDGSGDQAVDSPQRAEWSPVHSVEAIPGHAYLIWTWDDQFFRFVVNGASDQVVRCAWAAVDEDVHYSTRGILRNGSSRPVFVRTKFPR